MNVTVSDVKNKKLVASDAKSIQNSSFFPPQIFLNIEPFFDLTYISFRKQSSLPATLAISRLAFLLLACNFPPRQKTKTNERETNGNNRDKMEPFLKYLEEKSARDNNHPRIKPIVKEWGLSHTSLEDVFLEVTKRENFTYHIWIYCFLFFCFFVFILLVFFDCCHIS